MAAPGPARFPGEKRGMTRNHGRILFFAAKGAAGFLLNDAHFLSRKAEQID